MTLPFDSKRYGELIAELNMLVPDQASQILATASETTVLRILENFEIPDEVYWAKKLTILEKMIEALKNTPM